MPYPPSDKQDDLLFIELQTVDSTNNYALSRVYAGLAQHGTAIFSHEQRAGKGQRGKSWISASGENLAVSLLLDPAPLPLARQFQLSISVAVACHRVLAKYLGNEVRIKWPNDLYWQDRKAGGVLIENVVQGNSWKWAVAGIGFNVNQVAFPPQLKNPVSLRQITGKQFNVVELAKELSHAILDNMKLLASDPDSLSTYYKTNLYQIGKKVKLKAGNRIFDATIIGVTQEGKLLVNHGLEEEYSVGEIQWM